MTARRFLAAWALILFADLAAWYALIALVAS